MKIITHDNIYIRSLTKPEAKADIWLLHGLGESSLSFRHAFDLLKDEPFNLYAPDFPGFGASPARGDCQSIKELTQILAKLIPALSSNRPVHLVGHSMSGIVATELCHLMGNANMIKSLISIDGTIVLAPEVAQRLTAVTPQTVMKIFTDTFFNYAQAFPALMSYIASLNFADATTIYNFAQETYAYSGKEKSGARYLALDLPKLYIYGRQSWSGDSVAVIETNGQPTLGIDGGHWPMIDQPEKCYNSILSFIRDTSA